MLFSPTTMPPKSATDKLAEAKAKKEQMEHELEEVQTERRSSSSKQRLHVGSRDTMRRQLPRKSGNLRWQRHK